MNILPGFSRFFLFFSLLLVLLLPSCGGSSNNSTTIPAGSGTTIAGSTFTVAIPQGSFTRDQQVGFTETDATFPEFSGSSILSKAITLTFSEKLLVQSDGLTVTVRIDPELAAAAIASGQAIFIRSTEASNGITTVDSVEDGTPPVSSLWDSTIGDYDATSGAYTFTLHATSPSTTFVVVADDSLLVYLGEATNTASVAAAQNAKAAGTLDNWPQYPWAVICDKWKMSEEDIARYCSPDSSEFILPLIAANLTRISELYAALAWNRANLNTITAARIVRTNARSHPPVTAERASADDTIYNFAFFNTTLPGYVGAATPRGGYFAATKNVYFLPKSLDETIQQANGDIFAHEIFHAIQAAAYPLCIESEDYRWVSEGTAATLGFFALNPGTHDFRSNFIKAFRDWNAPLADNSYPNHYKVFEFFALLNDGDTTYFHDLFANLTAASSGNSLVDLDTALTAVLGLGVTDAYSKRVMPQRSADCVARDIQAEINNGSATIESNANTVLTPMSSHCMQVTASDNPASRSGNPRQQQISACFSKETISRAATRSFLSAAQAVSLRPPAPYESQTANSRFGSSGARTTSR